MFLILACFMDHEPLEFNQVVKDAYNCWVHAFEKHDLPDSPHNLSQERNLDLTVANFWLPDLFSIITDPF